MMLMGLNNYTLGKERRLKRAQIMDVQSLLSVNLFIPDIKDHISGA